MAPRNEFLLPFDEFCSYIWFLYFATTFEPFGDIGLSSFLAAAREAESWFLIDVDGDAFRKSFACSP